MERINKQTYSEVYAILNLMSLNLINKIPRSILENIENKKDKEDNIKIYDIKKHKVSYQANRILAVLYRDYFATEEEKLLIREKEKILCNRQQEELKKKYNVDNIFKQKKLILAIKGNKELLPIVVEEKRLWERIVIKIKSIFIKKR